MKLKLLSCAVAAIFSLIGCSQENISLIKNDVKTDKNVVKSNQSINELYQKATEVVFQNRALSATMYGLSIDEVQQNYTNMLEDYTPENEATLREKLANLSKQIKAYELLDKTDSNIDNQQVMEGITHYFSGHEKFSIGYIDTWMGLSPFIVNQINGPLIDIPRIMQNDQPITNKDQALNYITRLGLFDDLIAGIEKKLAFDIAQNWLPPKIILQGAIRYLKGFVSVKPEKHSFVSSFKDKVNKVASLSEVDKKELVNQAIHEVTYTVYPAYRSIANTAEKLLDKARDESGIWAQPNGAVFYQDAIHQLGDSNLSANEIHQLGLDEVKRITHEMDSILVSQGHKEKSVGDRMAAINDDPSFLYEDSVQGREALLTDINGYIGEITKKMSSVFKTVPSYQVEVRAFPIETQDGAPGGQYTAPAIDGSKPGIYWINLRDMKANPKFGLKTLTYHEANPGHHWQIALNMDQASLPFLRRIAPYNAYTEGWALYSEKVAEELGMYEGDPYGNLGRLQAELFRAVRLVVDTGMHYKRWTREQAITYMSEKTGTAESDVIAEIERYMIWPGQALGYKLGMLKILSLREYAKNTLGSKFDLGEFHDVVLLGGAVPMAVLDRNVTKWVKAYK